MLGRAQTGSGKTAAFGLPLLQRLLPQAQQAGARPGPRRPRALVLVPTRELAAQVGEVLRNLAGHLPGPRMKIAIAFGGVSINPQLMALRGGADAVVATPGRLLDLVEHNALSLSQVQALVLDEADRLLDLGFAEEPAARARLAAGAAPEPAVFRHLRAGRGAAGRGPAARSAAHRDRRSTRYRARHRPAGHRGGGTAPHPMLKQLLTQETGWTRVLVFVATQYAAEHVAEKLYQSGIYASPFHGDLSQGTRRQVLQEFRDERWQVLVTTDLAARGIDIAGLQAVINVDVAPDPEVHIHRIGRTGRADAEGLALSLASLPEMGQVGRIEVLQGRPSEWHPLSGLTPAPGGPLQPPMATIQIIGGRKKKIRAGDVLGALTGEMGFTREQVGKINVNDFSTYVAVERSVARQAAQRSRPAA